MNEYIVPIHIGNSLIDDIHPNIDSLKDFLICHYQQYKYYLPNKKKIDYICELGSRFAMYTYDENLDLIYKDDNNSLKAYSLWLSLFWLIDSNYDGYIYKLHSNLDDDVRFLLNVIGSGTDDSIIKDDFRFLVQTTYWTFLHYIQKYDLYKYSDLIYWSCRYIRSFKVIPKDIIEYEDYRLDGGAMMCVIWQLLIFYNLDIDVDSLRILRDIALVISYHNDLYSVDRDIKQNVPNLVNFYNNDIALAINKVNKLYSSIFQRLILLSEPLKSVCWRLIKGAFIWCDNEIRYAHGKRILQAVINSDHAAFNTLISQNVSSPGG